MRYLFSILFSVLVSMSFAHELTPQEALSNALQRLNSGVSAAKGSSVQSSMTLSYTENGTKTPLFYVFNKTNGGFIIAGADSRSTGLLGYTDDGTFDSAKASPAFQSWLSNCTAALEWLSQQPELTSSASQTTTLTTSVAPLLGDIKWNQDAPYNNQCPELKSGNRSATGCAATAMGQIMMYYKWPVTGTGSHTNSANASSTVLKTPGDITVDFSKSTYAWSAMKPTYTGSETDASADAVAKLMSDIGCALDMVYGDESGAEVTSVYQALATYFRYDKTAVYAERTYYTTADWNTLLRGELDNLRPILMGAQSTGGGHAFILDGYDTNGLYHVNWGWAGRSNGYFDINYMYPGDQGIGGNDSKTGYNMSQQVIVGIKKDESGTSVGVPDLKITRQITYDPDEDKPFSYTFTNIGIGDFNGVVGFALYNAKGTLLKEYPCTLGGAVSTGQNVTVSMSLPSSQNLAAYYHLIPYYRLSSSSEMCKFDNPLTAQPVLLYEYYSTYKMWYWFNGWDTSRVPADLTCTNIEIKRNYIGYAPKFSITVSNSSESTLEYNAPLYAFISKTTGTGKSATTTYYCYGMNQLFLDPGESKTIELDCVNDYYTSASEYKSYKDMTDGDYTYEICYNVGGYTYYLCNSNKERVTGTITMSTPKASKISYTTFSGSATTIKSGDTFTVTIPVKNDGGFTCLGYGLALFDANNNNVGQVTNSAVDILPNTTTTVSLSLTIDVEPGNYKWNVYSNESGSYKAIGGGRNLIVTSSTAIREVAADEEKDAVIYDLSGRRIKDIQKGGIYIINGKKVIQ